jgi:hypothetical protein
MPEPIEFLAWDGDVENIEPCFVLLNRLVSKDPKSREAPERDNKVQSISYWRPNAKGRLRTACTQIEQLERDVFETKYHLPWWYYDYKQRHRAIGGAMYGKTETWYYVNGEWTFKINNETGDVRMPSAAALAKRGRKS